MLTFPTTLRLSPHHPQTIAISEQINPVFGYLALFTLCVCIPLLD